VYDFADELRQIADAALYRTLRTLPATGGRFEWNGRTVLNFSSNDYLDLAGADSLKRAAHEAIDGYGCGATASRLMAGHLDIHDRLQQRLAAWLGMDAALVLGTGFQANLAVLTALTGPNDLIFSDQLNHASIIDGCRLSKAVTHRFAHNDMEHLERLLREHAGRGRRFIVTESVYSMDGDRAPAAELRRLADAFNAFWIVDEAHALGVFGPSGRGVCAEEGVSPDLLVGTLGKSLGGFGGFVAGSKPAVELLINRARPFIYSTGLPPACAASALAALDIVERDPELGATLLRRARGFTERLRRLGLHVPADPSQIVPVVLGSNATALAVAKRLVNTGILATAIRPPTVPVGTSRLRLSLTLAHTDEDLAWAAEHITQAVQRALAGVAP
jgi:8-amino-7-oxononanoate synthase